MHLARSVREGSLRVPLPHRLPATIQSAHTPRTTTLLLTLCVAACATVPSTPRDGAPSDVTGALDTQRNWWRALATGDTAFLQAHSASPLALTLSSGRTIDRATTIAQSATFAASPRPTFGWSDETVRLIAPRIAVATTRATESAALATSAYRYTTVLERDGAGWRVISAQSTRDAVFTPRLTTSASGSMADYVGDYRGPRGGIIRVVARDSVLALVEPSRRELRMEPIGPSLFEFDYVSPAGVIIRVAFARDASGRVTSANRLIPGHVNTFVRVP